MRSLVLLLFCLSIAVHGVVKAGAIHMPCPMEQAGHGAEIDATTPAQDDCCNDAETAAKTGHLCKAGAGCQSLSLCVSISHSHACLAPAVYRAITPINTLLAAGNPASVWRPPELI